MAIFRSYITLIYDSYGAYTTPLGYTIPSVLSDESTSTYLTGNDFYISGSLEASSVPIDATNIAVTIYASGLAYSGVDFTVQDLGDAIVLSATMGFSGSNSTTFTTNPYTFLPITPAEVNALSYAVVSFYHPEDSCQLDTFYIEVSYDTGDPNNKTIYSSTNYLSSSVSRPGLTIKPGTANLLPTFDYSATGTWSGSVGSRYTLVQTGSTYVTHGNTAGQILFGKAALNLPSNYTISSVEVVYTALKVASQAANIRAAISDGTNTSLGTLNTFNAGNVAQTFTQAFTTAPNGSAWTYSNIDSFYFGVGSTDASPNLQVSLVKLVIKYDWVYTNPSIGSTANTIASTIQSPSLVVTKNIGSTANTLNETVTSPLVVKRFNLSVGAITAAQTISSPVINRIRELSSTANNQANATTSPTIVRIKSITADPVQIGIATPLVTVIERISLANQISLFTGTISSPLVPKVGQITITANSTYNTSTISTPTVVEIIAISVGAVSQDTTVTLPVIQKQGQGVLYWIVYRYSSPKPTANQIIDALQWTYVVDYGNVASPSSGITTITEDPIALTPDSYGISWVYSDGTITTDPVHSGEYVIAAAFTSLTVGFIQSYGIISQPTLTKYTPINLNVNPISSSSVVAEALVYLGTIKTLSVPTVTAAQQIAQATLTHRKNLYVDQVTSTRTNSGPSLTFKRAIASSPITLSSSNKTARVLNAATPSHKIPVSSRISSIRLRTE